jgi:hypothetical protein
MAAILGGEYRILERKVALWAKADNVTRLDALTTETLQ